MKGKQVSMKGKQTSKEGKKIMTTSSGCPILNPNISLSAGKNGPTLVEDVELFDKLQHFDREQLPARNVHASGVGAFGTFKPTKDVSKYTCANLFSKDTGETPLFVRFSGVFTGREEAETVRDMKGFALKFYTKEGIWDLLTVNVPVFGVSDAKSGPDAIHAFKRDLKTGEWSNDTVWDYTVTHPEALHQTILLLHDQYGTPNSYRNMSGFSCNTFSFINKDGERRWVRFHLVSDLPKGGLTGTQANLVAGEDPDFLRRDLRTSIEKGIFPKWKLCFQTMSEEEGYQNGEWAFDATRFWSTKTYPLTELGVIELNKYPSDHHQVEQSAFSPANVVPGISFSPDRLLQGRLFLYGDTQLHRLGPNYRQIPINAPKNHCQTPYIGGSHRLYDSKYPSYSPSLIGGTREETKGTPSKQKPIRCEAAGYFGTESTKLSHFDQIRETIKQTPDNNLALNIARSLFQVTNKELIEESIKLLRKVDEGLVRDVEGLMSKIEEGDRSVVSEGDLLVRRLRKNLSEQVFRVED